MTQKSSGRRRGGRGRRRAAEAPAEPPAETLPEELLEPAPEPVDEPAETTSLAFPLPTLSPPEPGYVARIPPPAPERPKPATRRAIFFDVENSSRADHVARVLAHLGIDRIGTQTELVAVGNWRVVNQDTARMLAQQGAHLVHSAPSVGVRDWSDLRIAVTAGVWLAGARAGDAIVIISDDQAFDAVGDVAASLGVRFQRLSFRALAGVHGELPEVPVTTSSGSGSSRSRRRRRGGRGRHRGSEPAPPPRVQPFAAANGGEPGADAHTAPHDELLAVARELLGSSAERAITLDALSNALKAHGFRRTPGSPRLITRLRRIKELEVGRNGTIRLVDTGEPEPAMLEHYEATDDEPSPADEGPGELQAEEGGADLAGTPRRRRRRRRGGRGRRRRGGGQPSAPTP